MRKDRIAQLGTAMLIVGLTLFGQDNQSSVQAKKLADPWCTSKNDCLSKGWNPVENGACSPGLVSCEKPAAGTNPSKPETAGQGSSPLVNTARCLKEDPNFLNINSITSYSYIGSKGGTTTNPEVIKSILNASGRNIWVGYNSQYGGFDVPINSITDHLQTVFILPNSGGKTNYIYFYAPPEKPDEIYGMAFSEGQIKSTSTDSKGSHDGNHPCGVAAISKTQYNEWLRQMGSSSRSSSPSSNPNRPRPTAIPSRPRK